MKPIRLTLRNLKLTAFGDYFADGYRENVFEGSLNLADTPWTESAANPNPHFDRGETTTNSYFDYDDLEL